jgi:hypothetical protein
VEGAAKVIQSIFVLNSQDFVCEIINKAFCLRYIKKIP